MFMRSPEGTPQTQTLENIWKFKQFEKLKHFELFYFFKKILSFQMLSRVWALGGALGAPQKHLKV